MMKYIIVLGIFAVLVFLFFACEDKKSNIKNTDFIEAPFDWGAANLYFLLTDRFYNGDPSIDTVLDRTKPTGKLRNFMGGDIKGIIQKLEDGYFTKLGINAIWFSPVVEQVHGCVDEGTGNTYGFHGYWAKDWTAIDPNFGTWEDLDKMVQLAHSKGIRVVIDVVLNHTGPNTDKDASWGTAWVRDNPVCSFDGYKNTVTCNLVKNLPDIITEHEGDVELPDFLVEKWKKEGRYDKEMKELEEFFEQTKYPKAPKYYIIKWLTDFIKKLGIDGFRVDTAKHVEEEVWVELRKQADRIFGDWKKKHSEKVLDDNKFFMVGEVYGYYAKNGRIYDFGDKKVDYFNHGFDALINFDFKIDAHKPYDTLYSTYQNHKDSLLKGGIIMNYIHSHDDSYTFDQQRKKPYESATKLLLSHGISQTYYGDETARRLDIEGTEGDAHLRSFMNWEDLENNAETKKIFDHWCKLGVFRKEHPAVGKGDHVVIKKSPLTFSRKYQKGDYVDNVLVVLDNPNTQSVIDVSMVFAENQYIKDYYSGVQYLVNNGKIKLTTQLPIVLLGRVKRI